MYGIPEGAETPSRTFFPVIPSTEIVMSPLLITIFISDFATENKHLLPPFKFCDVLLITLPQVRRLVRPVSSCWTLAVLGGLAWAGHRYAGAARLLTTLRSRARGHAPPETFWRQKPLAASKSSAQASPRTLPIPRSLTSHATAFCPCASRAIPHPRPAR